MMLPSFYPLNNTRLDDTEKASTTDDVQDDIEHSISVNPMNETMNINKSPVKPLGLSQRQQTIFSLAPSTTPSERWTLQSIENNEGLKPGNKRFKSMNQSEFSNMLHR